MSTPGPGRRIPLEWRAYVMGLALWGVCSVATWPRALSYQDEVGYAGQARLLLEGHVRPMPNSPGIWVRTPGGPIPRYPLFFPAIIAPLFAISPRAAFAVPFCATVLLSYLVARVLRTWEADPSWGLLVLVHPTFLLLSRTLMVDSVLALSAMAAWWSLRRHLTWQASALCGLAVLCKPTGIPLVLALLIGEALRARSGSEELLGQGAVWWGGIGAVLGLMAVAALNVLATGTPWYGYAALPVRVEFGFEYLATSGLAHALTFIILPPGLIGGLWVLWQRREYGPVLGAGVILGVQSVYYFVDRGRGWIDSLVLSPRLVLPAVAFALIGYGLLMCRVTSFTGAFRRLPLLLVLATPAVALTLGAAHAAAQEVMEKARVAAEQVLVERGGGVLGLTGTANKAGLLSKYPVCGAHDGKDRPEIVLCATEVPSYREPGVTTSCDLPGYETIRRIGSYRILALRRPEMGARRRMEEPSSRSAL